MKRKSRFLCIGFCLLLTASCGDNPFNLWDKDSTKTIDPRLELTREDYRNIHDAAAYEKPGAPGEALNPAEPPVPELEEVLAAPQPPKIGATRLVSVAVTDDVPLKDVLIELARLADIDIEVDAGITGGVSFRAKDRPFNEVIERIADLAGLRYTMKNGVLRVERDTPYIQTYSLDFLNFTRTSSSSMAVNTNVLSASAGGEGGGGSLSSGSTVSLSSEGKSDFWGQFAAGIAAILAYAPPSRVSATTVAAQPTLPAADDEAAAPAAAAAAAPAAAAPAPEGGSFHIINQEASTLTVSGTQQQHDLVQRFLEKVRANVSSQVLIEAKIVEVTLNDRFQSGIDWSQLSAGSVDFPFQFGAVSDPGNVATFSFSGTDLTGLNIDLAAAIQLTENFGTTRTLSSPRLHAMNNQQAVLTFAENTVYFDIEVDRETTTSTTGPTTELTVNATIHTVPIGIIMALQPSINMETSEVTLSVRPTLSRITGFVNNPSLAFALRDLDPEQAAGLQSQIPIIEVRELDSILKLKSGQVMVIGGLMEEKAQNTDQGVPWLTEVPYVGNVFKGIDKNRDVKELVIFIRATIVGSHGNAHPMDKAVYDKFTRDPRPLQF